MKPADHAKPDTPPDPPADRNVGWPSWWPMLISTVGMGIAIFEAFNNYQNWPVTGLAASMIMGGIPAAVFDSWLRGRT